MRGRPERLYETDGPIAETGAEDIPKRFSRLGLLTRRTDHSHLVQVDRGRDPGGIRAQGQCPLHVSPGVQSQTCRFLSSVSRSWVRSSSSSLSVV